MPLHTEKEKAKLEKDTPHLQTKPVRIFNEKIALTGEISYPESSVGIIVFSQENLPTDRTVFADTFTRNKITALFPDFTSFPEGVERGSPFRAEEVGNTVLWTRENPETSNLHLGIYASGPGVTAALIAAAQYPEMIQAVVIQGGRPDRLPEVLSDVKAPVLLIAGGRDAGCLRSHRFAQEKLDGLSSLNVIPRASQSFHEPGALEEAAQLAALWFLQHLN